MLVETRTRCARVHALAYHEGILVMYRDTVRTFALSLSLALAVLLAVAPRTPAAPSPAGPNPAIKYDHGRLTISQDGKKVALTVEIAKTVDARSQGLMFRKSLRENAGMLFQFEEDSTGAFWMKNTLIPLSIGFIDNQWKLLDVKDMKVEPDPERPANFYGPSMPYRYALEVNMGFFQRNGITPGAHLELIVPK